MASPSAAAQDLYSQYRARKQAPNDQMEQDLRAPIEHQQMVQEVTEDDPISGAALALAAPAYTAAKMYAQSNLPGSGAARSLVNYAGTGEAKTSTASSDEIFRAWDGFAAGLKARSKQGK